MALKNSQFTIQCLNGCLWWKVQITLNIMVPLQLWYTKALELSFSSLIIYPWWLIISQSNEDIADIVLSTLNTVLKFYGNIRLYISKYNKVDECPLLTWSRICQKCWGGIYFNHYFDLWPLRLVHMML